MLLLVMLYTGGQEDASTSDVIVSALWIAGHWTITLIFFELLPTSGYYVEQYLGRWLSYPELTY